MPYRDSRNNLFYNMKTILEWLNEAKEQGYEWAEAAIRNYNCQWTGSSPKNKVNSLVRALEVAFSWSDSPEKEVVWRGVYDSLRTADAGYRVLSPTTPVTPIPLEDLIKDLGKLNIAIGNLEHNDTLKEPYRTQVYETTKASYEEQLAEVKAEIAKKLGIEPPKERKLIGWVMQNEDGGYSKRKVATFIKGDGGWSALGGISWSNITHEEAATLCDRLPKWDDDEPTPIYE